MAISLVSFAACEVAPEGPVDNSTNADANAVLEVKTQKVEAHFAGGTNVVEYSLTGVAEGYKATPDATVNVDWVEVGAIEDGKVNFVVSINDTTERRVATLTLSYGEQSFNVFVEQAEGYTVDVEFVAGALNGQYDGTTTSIDPNYFAILSKNGTTGWGIGHLYLDTYYRFDIYSKTESTGDKVILPNGTYIFDYLNTGIGDTFGDFYSVRLETFQDGTFKETKIEDGAIIVTDNKFEAILKMVDGKVHRVVYEGSLELGYIPIPEPDYYSTLTEDYTFNHPDGILRLSYFGDYYNIGAANWIVSMVLPGRPINGDYFVIDLVTANNVFDESNVMGTYTCVADETQVAKNVFFAGDYSEGFFCSWYFVCEDDSFGSNDLAPLSGGTVTISQDDSGATPKYVVEFDCVDDNNHKIKGTFTCSAIEIYDSRD